MDFFKRKEPVETENSRISEMLAAADRRVVPEQETVDNRPMVQKVQGMVGKALTSLIHQEHDLVAQLADVTERLRQVRVSIEALSGANEVLVTDMNESDLVKGVEDIAAEMQRETEAALTPVATETAA